MNESFWLEAAKQVPALLLFVVFVVYIVREFLAHITKMSDRFEAIHKEMSAQVKEITDAAREFQRSLSAENARVMEKVSRVIDENNRVLGRNGIVSKHQDN